MNKKEINEIKSLFDTIEDNGIEQLAGCYVDGDKNIVSSFSKSFYNLEREEMYKYLEIFRKTLSGTQGKNLLDMRLRADSTRSDGMKLLEALRKSELKDDNLKSEFFNQIIDTYDYVGSYLVLLIYQAYDVPGITADGLEMDDASDEVFSFLLCSICPISMTKPGLGYDEGTNDFHSLKQDKYVELPANGFLYPAFNERSTDTDALLYYTKSVSESQEKLMGGFFGVQPPLPAAEQKETFQSIVKETVAEDTEVEVVTAIQQNLSRMISDKKKSEPVGEPVVIHKEDVTRVLEESGLGEAKIKTFEKRFDAEFKTDDGSADLYAANVVPPRSKLEVKTPDVVVKINYEKTSLVETRVIDGKKCLVIELGAGLVINGIPVGE